MCGAFAIFATVIKNNTTMKEKINLADAKAKATAAINFLNTNRARLEEKLGKLNKEINDIWDETFSIIEAYNMLKLGIKKGETATLQEYVNGEARGAEIAVVVKSLDMQFDGTCGVLQAYRILKSGKPSDKITTYGIEAADDNFGGYYKIVEKEEE